MWLALMFDDWFKERFAVVFMQQYESLVLVGDPALERVTVQVLSIRALLERLLRLGLLLPQLFACRLSLQQSVSYQGLPPYCVNVKHPLLKRRSYVNSMNDIRYLLAERDMLSECTHCCCCCCWGGHCLFLRCLSLCGPWLSTNAADSRLWRLLRVLRLSDLALVPG